MTKSWSVLKLSKERRVVYDSSKHNYNKNKWLDWLDRCTQQSVTLVNHIMLHVSHYHWRADVCLISQYFAWVQETTLKSMLMPFFANSNLIFPEILMLWCIYSHLCPIVGEGDTRDMQFNSNMSLSLCAAALKCSHTHRSQTANTYAAFSCWRNPDWGKKNLGGKRSMRCSSQRQAVIRGWLK